MNVLVITGDRAFTQGNPRYELQRGAVEGFGCIYWGRERMWPKVPSGRWDVVSAQDPFMRGVVAWLIARRRGAKFNLQVHANLKMQPLWKRAIAAVVLRHADSIRVVSEELKNQLLKKKIHTSVTVLPIFIDLHRLNNLERDTRGGSCKTILWLGRFEEEKDPHYALQVVRELFKRGVDVRLIMLGKGSLEEELYVNAKGLPVEFPGWRDPVPYLAKADVVLSTSPAESYGASIVEALAAGVPVVSLDVGVAKEAGAIVVSRDRLVEEIRNVLKNSPRAVLKLPVLSADEWARKWRASLQ